MRTKHQHYSVVLPFISAANAKTVSMLRAMVVSPSRGEETVLPVPSQFGVLCCAQKSRDSGVPLIKLATKLLCSMAIQSFARRCAPAPTSVASKPRTELIRCALTLHPLRQHAALYHGGVKLFQLFSIQNWQDFWFGFFLFCGSLFRRRLAPGVDFALELLPFVFWRYRRIYFSFYAA